MNGREKSDRLVVPVKPPNNAALVAAEAVEGRGLREGNAAADVLRKARLERAIGVIYRPETERLSHYFFACLPEQFDAVVHWDETTAVVPLERVAPWQTGEAPETYPSGQ